MNHPSHQLCALAKASTRVAFAAFAACATALLHAGCGGSAPDADAAAVPNVATDIGEPADHGARTRQGRYLSAEQAREMAKQLDERVVTVVAGCCGLENSELDVMIAFGMQAAEGLGQDAPFVVSGNDLRQASAVANRLSELGAQRVYLVTR